MTEKSISMTKLLATEVNPLSKLSKTKLTPTPNSTFLKHR